MSDTVPVTFLYALGSQVRWAGHADLPWTIVQRRYYEGTVSRYVTYGLALTTATVAADAAEAYEADLEAWEEGEGSKERGSEGGKGGRE